MLRGASGIVSRLGGSLLIGRKLLGMRSTLDWYGKRRRRFSAATGSAGSGDFAGLVDIGGGRKMYLECRGTGSPTVVLLAGLKASAEDWNIAEKPVPTVFAEVAKFTRVCAYDRPGTPVVEKPSRSDPVRQPTTAEDAVADLHALLSAAN